jgi:MFS family permease
MLVSARALTGAASGCFIPTARALVSGIGEDGRSERLGRMASVEVGGFIVGPVVGGALVGPLGIRWPFVIFCVLAALATVVIASAPLPVLEARENSGRIAVDLLKQRPMVVAVLISMSLGLPIGMYDALWARYLSDLGAKPWLVGVSLACYSVPFMVFAGVGGRLADRFGPRRTAIRAMFFITPLTVSYSLFKNPWIPILVGICESMIQAAAMPASQSVVANASPPGRAAGGQGLVGATNVATMAIVALISSWLYGKYGVRTTFVAVACAAATCAFAANLVSIPLRRAAESSGAADPVSADAALGATPAAVLESGS